MPLLSFACKECGKLFEEFADANKLNDVRCPDCGNTAERAYQGKVYGGTPKQSAAAASCAAARGAMCASCPHAQAH